MDSSDIKSITIDHFEVKGKLAQGGMGIVYLAHEAALGRDVALKFLSAELSRSPKVCERFDREAKAAAVLQHPNIVSIYFRGNFKGRPYFAMEYIDGGSLEDLGKRGLMRPDVAIDFMIQTAEGLNAAWVTGKVHRDIKPANLMVTSSNIIKIADFGLAKALDSDSSLTTANMIVGTPDFISPEQAQGDAVDCRSDIYSLGATFYFLTSGKMPFTGDTAMGILVKHISATLPPLSSQNRLLPVDFCDTIEKMMAKKPEDRFQTPRELVSHLEKLKVSVAAYMDHLAGETTVSDLSGPNRNMPSDISSSDTILTPSGDVSSSETIVSQSVKSHNAATQFEKTPAPDSPSEVPPTDGSSTGKTLLSGERARPALNESTSGKKRSSRGKLKPISSVPTNDGSSSAGNHMKIGAAVLAVLLLIIGGIRFSSSRLGGPSGNGGEERQYDGSGRSVVDDGGSVVDNGGSYAVAMVTDNGSGSSIGSNASGGSFGSSVAGPAASAGWKSDAEAMVADSVMVADSPIVANNDPGSNSGSNVTAYSYGTSFLSKAKGGVTVSKDGSPVDDDGSFLESEQSVRTIEEYGITVLENLPPELEDRGDLDESTGLFAGFLSSGRFIEGNGVLNFVMACASIEDGEKRIHETFRKMVLPLPKLNKSWDANMKLLSMDYRPRMIEVWRALKLPFDEIEPIFNEFIENTRKIHEFSVLHPDTPRTRKVLLSFFKKNKDVLNVLEKWRVQYVTGMIDAIREGNFNGKSVDVYKLSLMILVHTRLDMRLLYDYFAQTSRNYPMEDGERWDSLERAYSALFCKVLEHFSIPGNEMNPYTMNVQHNIIRKFVDGMDMDLVSLFFNSMQRGDLDRAEATFYEVARNVSSAFAASEKPFVKWPEFIDHLFVENRQAGIWPLALKELYTSLGDPMLSEISRANDPAMSVMNRMRGWLQSSELSQSPQNEMQKAFEQEIEGAWSPQFPQANQGQSFDNRPFLNRLSPEERKRRKEQREKFIANQPKRWIKR
jgi:serine/threonine protein kinase